MADISLDWPSSDGSGTQGDFQLDSTGDLLIVAGVQETRQRLVRRFLSNPRGQNPDGSLSNADDCFNISYGVGLGRLVGSANTDVVAAQIRQNCLDAFLQEDGVAASPPPTVQMQIISGGIAVQGLFTSAITKQPVATPKIALTS